MFKTMRIRDDELIDLLTGHKQMDDFCSTEERVQWQGVIDTVRAYDNGDLTDSKDAFMLHLHWICTEVLTGTDNIILLRKAIAFFDRCEPVDQILERAIKAAESCRYDFNVSCYEKNIEYATLNAVIRKIRSEFDEKP